MTDVNVEDLSIDEWRAATFATLTQVEKQESEKAEPARDDKGRFVAKAEEVAVEEKEAVEEVDEVVYETIVDVGDGAGVQVFRGASHEELIDKLREAQVNATRKIREQEAELRAKAEKKVEEVTGLTEDEKYILSQKILTDPESVIQTFVDKAISKKVAPRLAEVEATAKEQRETKTAVDWVNSNPDYYASPRNGAKIQKYLEKLGQEITPENLQSAFEDLSADGLLATRPKEKQDAENDVEEAQPERIAPKVETVVKRKVVGGLSTKRQAPVAPRSPEPTDQDLDKIADIDAWRAEVRRRLS